MYNLGMKKNFASILNNALIAGVRVRVAYTDLSGIWNEREAYVESINGNFAVIKGAFGYRSIRVDRVTGAGL
jgi:hypothetical protein